MNDLVMAIADEEYGPLIREKRVFPPAERRMDERVARLTAAMREQGLLDETSKDGQRNLKRLGELAEHPGKLIDMEHDFLSEDQRRSNGEWIADDEYFIHEEVDDDADD